MADFEGKSTATVPSKGADLGLDSNAPTWSNLVLGQKNLYDAIRSALSLGTDLQS